MMASARESFTPGQYVDVVVSYVEGPQKFYVQPLGSAAELRNMTKKLQVLFGGGVVGGTDLAMTLDHLAIGLRTQATSICWCAAPFQVDTPPNAPPVPIYYYRAAVLERAGPSTVKVFFVDYGNTSIVPIAALKILPPSFQEMPCMAIPCRLLEGDFGDHSIIDPVQFNQVVDGYHVVVYVSPNHPVSANNRPPYATEPMWVSMFMTDGKDEANIGEILVNNAQGGAIESQ